MKEFWVIQTGKKPYGEVLELQKTLEEARLKNTIPDVLILTEHTTVITAGRRAKEEDLLETPSTLMDQGIDLFYTDRGGEFTLHNPGQLVAYPIFQLKDLGCDVKKFVALLENAMMDTLMSFGISSGRRAPFTGVWVNPLKEDERKIGFLGIHLKRWVSRHGIALNIKNELSDFSKFVPCGIESAMITNMERELGRELNFKEVQTQFLNSFAKQFQVTPLHWDINQFQSSRIVSSFSTLSPGFFNHLLMVPSTIDSPI